MPDTVVVSSSATLACQPYATNKLVTIIGRFAGLASDSTLRAGVLDMLNLAVQEVDVSHDWAYQEVTAATIAIVAGTQTYTLPSDFKRIYDVRMTGGTGPERTLFAIDQRQYDRMLQRTTSTFRATPTHYMLFAAFGTKNITLIPIPDQANNLSIRYYKTQPILVDSATDNLCIPFRSLIPVIYKAVALTTAWKSPELSDLWEKKYALALQRAIADDNVTVDDVEAFLPMVEWAAKRVDYVNPDDLSFYPR